MMKAKSERDNETPSCAAVAPLLTALFDGEADAQATQSARAHLLSCERCARAWLDWNQHRAILRNERVPAPPPTLLWRVLLTCRLANPTRGPQAARKAPVPHAPVYSDAAPRATRRDSLFPEPPLLGDLSARILAQTTRRDGPGPARSSPSSRSLRPRWSLASWPTLAMPALAAWMIMLGQSLQPAGFEAPLAESDIVVSAPPGAAGNATVAPFAGSENTAAAPRTGTKSALHAAPAPVRHAAKASLTPLSVRHAAPTAAVTRVVTSHAALSRTLEARSSASRVRPVAMRVAVQSALPRESRVTRVASQVARVVAPERAASVGEHPRSVAAISQSASERARPVLTSAPQTAMAPLNASTSTRRAALSDEVRAPRARLARPVVTPISSDNRASLRPSRPMGALTVAAPRLAALETPDMAEEHVEEWRSVVDSFRSSVSGDEGTDTLDSDAG